MVANLSDVHSQNPEIDIPNVKILNIKILNVKIPNVKILKAETNIQNSISGIAKILKINFPNDQNPETRKKDFNLQKGGNLSLIHISEPTRPY